MSYGPSVSGKLPQNALIGIAVLVIIVVVVVALGLSGKHTVQVGGVPSTTAQTSQQQNTSPSTTVSSTGAGQTTTAPSGGNTAPMQCGPGGYCLSQSQAVSLMPGLATSGYFVLNGSSPNFLNIAYRAGGPIQNLNFTNAVLPNLTGAYLVTINASRAGGTKSLGMVEAVYQTQHPIWVYDAYMNELITARNESFSGLTFSYLTGSGYTDFAGYDGHTVVFVVFNQNSANATAVAQAVVSDLT